MSDQNSVIFYENMVPGEFVKRNNRFSATVRIRYNEDNMQHDKYPGNGNSAECKEEIVHVKNTGRLKELLVPNAKVKLQKAGNPERKTAYDLVSVYKQGLGWVNIDSLVPNALVKQELMSRGYTLVKPEYTFGDSRFDFYMEKGRLKYLTEVKGCTLAPDPETETGYFPDAPTTRGVKHLNELAEAVKAGYHCTVAFVIQMNGIHKVFPNDPAQPEFREALVKAARAGVRIVYYSCHVEADSIRITDVMDDTERYI